MASGIADNYWTVYNIVNVTDEERRKDGKRANVSLRNKIWNIFLDFC